MQAKMPSINLDLDYFEHPKTGRLIGLLGRGSEVVPIRLWVFCGKHYSGTGRLTEVSAQEIETAVAWWGKPGQAVEALLTCGFLERHNGTYVVHDWLEHSGHIAVYRKRAKEAAKARWEKHASRTKDMLQASENHASSNASSNACLSSGIKRENSVLSYQENAQHFQGVNGEAKARAPAPGGYFPFKKNDAKEIVAAYQTAVDSEHTPHGAIEIVKAVLGNGEATKEQLLAAIARFGPKHRKANPDRSKRKGAPAWFREKCWADFLDDSLDAPNRSETIVYDDVTAQRIKAEKEKHD